MIEGNRIQLPQTVKTKIQQLNQVLNQEVIDVKKLRRLVNRGVPEQAPQLREVSWKVLLKYLPSQKSEWSSVKQNYKQTYLALIKKFISPEQFPQYPILLSKTHPQYSIRVKDYQLWQQIQKDVIRTRSTISFLSQKTNQKIVIPYLTESRKQKFKEVYCQKNYSLFLQNKQQQQVNYIHDHLSRILYLYSKLNPNVGYVQGMNQILAPIFFTVNNHKHLDDIDEQSSFFLLNSLMAQVIDLHMIDMDKSDQGIYGKVNLINETLRVIEPVLWLQLKSKQVDPVCYNFKWLVVLFAQQFEIFDVCRLWDSLLTYKNIKVYLMCISLGIIQSKHKQIQEGDSIQVLRALQQLKQQNIQQVIQNASEIYRMIGKKDLDKLILQNKQALKDQDE